MGIILKNSEMKLL